VSRHELDVTSLIFGVVLTALGVSFLVAEANDADVDLTWLLAAALVAAGVIAVSVGLARTLRHRPRPQPEPAPSDDLEESVD
jgi:uncharacterized membrane protein HdeD (DUF308 family)